MAEEPNSDVLGALPRTRPHRRSTKRAARPALDAAVTQAASRPEVARGPEVAGAAGVAGAPRRTERAPVAESRPRPKPERLRQPAQPDGVPVAPRGRKPAPADGVDVLSTAVQAAAELAEIALAMSARAIRGAVSRLPRP